MPRHEDEEELKQARGTLRADRQTGTIPFTALERMRNPPKGLIGRIAKLEYGRVVRALIEDGLVAQADRSLLVAYCNEITRYRQLAEDIAECEEIGATPPKGTDFQATQALKNAMKLGEMFGLTPAGRSKIKPGKAKKKPDADSTENQFNNLKAS